jgi:tyrosyl-tRNA synthetase
MQALDEEHLDVDVQFGGVDQRKIFILAAEQLPRIGYKERGHLMNTMVPGLAGGKMSSSDPDSKIDILDTPEAIKKKIKKAFAVPKELEGNGMISFVEYVLFPVSALKHGKGKFVIERREGEGEPLIYETIEALKEDYVADKVRSSAL